MTDDSLVRTSCFKAPPMNAGHDDMLRPKAVQARHRVGVYQFGR
jgi:hypothetical protein